MPDEELFVQNSTCSSPGYLKRRFLQTGVEYKCHTCDQPPYWNGHELVLQLEHIDGDISNNTLENLTIICPNCHSQTSTYRGKNKKNKGGHLYKKCKCGAKIRKRSKQCTSCATKQRYNTKYPPIEKLIEAIQEKGYSAVAREIGVSDNAVRKHIAKTKRASKT